MIILAPVLLTVLLWLWLRLKRDHANDFDDIRDVEIVALGTVAIWVGFAAYILLAEAA